MRLGFFARSLSRPAVMRADHFSDLITLDHGIQDAGILIDQGSLRPDFSELLSFSNRRSRREGDRTASQPGCRREKCKRERPVCLARADSPEGRQPRRPMSKLIRRER